MSKSSICPRNGPPQWVDRPRSGARIKRAAGQEPAGNELISVRRGAAIESLAFRTIGDSLSGIIRQQRIRDVGSWRSAPRARMALDGTRKLRISIGTLTMWRVVHATLLTILLLRAGQAQAIEGGASAHAGDPLAGATVAVRAIDLEGKNRIGLTHCSGVLIAADLVVTAAHCIPTDKKLAALGVFFYQGAQASREPVMVTDVVRRSGSGTVPLIPMDDLQSRIGRLGSDFAVLRLAHPVVDRRPIPVANSSQRIPSAFRLAGVGISGRVAGTLRTAALKTAFELGSPRLAVANAVGARVCLGDSGGPAVIRERGGGVSLWGIATAVITPRGPCGSIVVVTPVALDGIESQ
jgi:hypothetical protein